MLFTLAELARSCTNKYFKYYRCDKSSLYSSYAITLNAGLGGTNCTTVNGSSVMTSIDLSDFISYAYKFMLALAVVLAVFMITVGGFEYMLSGAADTKNDAKKKIWDAVWGLVLALVAYLLLYTIDPNLVSPSNLSIPPITHSSSQTPRRYRATNSIKSAQNTSGAIVCPKRSLTLAKHLLITTHNLQASRLVVHLLRRLLHNKTMSRKISYSIIIILILAILGGFAYFFFYLNKPAPAGNNSISTQNPFTPFGGGGVNSNQGSNTNGVNGTSTVANNGQIYQYPKVREIWPTPIGGFVASTTASSTFVRFVDRGTGYIYDMNMASATPANISNTTVPLVYESYWNSNGMSGIFRYIKEGSDDITNFYVQLRSTATTTKTVVASSTATTSIPFKLLRCRSCLKHLMCYAEHISREI